MISKSTLRSFEIYYKTGMRVSRAELMKETLMLSAPTAQRLILDLLGRKKIKAVENQETDFHLTKMYEVL